MFVTSWYDVIQSHCQYCAAKAHIRCYMTTLVQCNLCTNTIWNHAWDSLVTSLPYYVIAQQQAVVILYDTDIWITAVIRFLDVTINELIVAKVANTFVLSFVILRNTIRFDVQYNLFSKHLKYICVGCRLLESCKR